MIKFSNYTDIGALEHWPFDNPASQYKVLRGAPVASGRLDAGGAGHTTRFGIWRCTAGAFECVEQGDELMTVLSGACVLTNHSTGDIVDLKAGDSLFIRDQSHVTWDIREDITKVFHGFKSDGY